MIFAISGSPRKNRIVHTTLQLILEDCIEPHEILSLAGKKINACIACERCATDNLCKLKDDWMPIGEKMRQADIIIFGAPNYFGSINALSHACLERSFSFRHRDVLALKGKFGITVTARRAGTDSTAVKAMIERVMLSNGMELLGHVDCDGYNPCYTCGYGQDCHAGAVVKTHGVLSEILPCHLPKEVSEQAATLENIKTIRTILQEKGVRFEK